MMEVLRELERARRERYAVLAANFYNAETLLAVLRAAQRTKSAVILQTSPATLAVLRAAQRTKSAVILQTSPATLEYLGVEQASAMACAAAHELGVRAYIHLDHASDVGLVRRCLAFGYDSVMLDASEEDFDTNVERTREVVALAHRSGKAVEAELGYVPKLGQSPASAGDFTSVEQAAAFVEATGVDFLAVAVGSAHGFYKEAPRLDYERLAAIRDAVKVPLVLHGSSGLGDEQLRMAIARGISKINFATEIKDTFMRALKRSMSCSDDIDLRKTFPPAIDAATGLVESKMLVCKGA
jgi:fructose-bisphosphate aldolase class II/tagatose 1,6-diphosphate aldolase GatY/KbaY